MAFMGQFEPQRCFESYPVGASISIEGQFDWKIYENTENGYKIYTFDIEKIIDSDGTDYVASGTVNITGYYEVNEVSGKLPCRIQGTVTAYRGDKQLSAEKVEFIEPATMEGIIAFLGSGIIKGIGEKTAIKIVKGYATGSRHVEGFGENTLEVIKNDHNKLTRLKGITPVKAQMIHESYMENMEYQNVMIFFQKYAISPNKAMKIYNAFRGRAMELASDNPYMFLFIKGFGFKTCDEISRKMGLNPHSPHRLEAGIRHILETSEMNGHCYLFKSELSAQAGSNLDIGISLQEARRLVESHRSGNGEDEVPIKIDGLTYHIPSDILLKKINGIEQEKGSVKDARIIIDEIPREEIAKGIESMIQLRSLIEVRNEEMPEDVMIYTWKMYNMERETASAIQRIVRSETTEIFADVDKLIHEFEEKKGFQLEDMQRQSIKAAFNTNMLILTGSAGSGKTTTVEGMIYVLGRVFGTDAENLRFMLAAPTGKAAKRLTEVTGFEAKTIHRLLQFSFEGGGFYYKAENHLPYKLIIIDESSMLSIDLAYALFSAIAPGTKVVLIGDIQQLPSVGAGNVLKDMIRSGGVNVVELNVIKRQADGSGIITNANRIIRGEIPQSDFDNKDFFIVEESDKLRVVKRTLEAVSKLMNTYGYPIEDVQVICPQRTSEIGTYEMNKAIQGLVNPPSEDKPEVTRGNGVFRVGDKVIHLNNNYEAVHYTKNHMTGEYEQKESTGVFNGDIGKIIEIIQEEDGDDANSGDVTLKVAVQYDDFVICYEKPDMEEIELAYSLTVHKMQGSQCGAAVILCHMRNYSMLSRNLGYTALTRAQQMACIIGQTKALSVMVQNVKVAKRNTLLGEYLSG